MKDYNHNIAAYFLNLKLDDIPAIYDSFNKLAIVPVFEQQALEEIKKSGINEQTFLVNNNKVWGWDTRKDTSVLELKDINLDELLKILELPTVDKIPTLDLDNLLENKFNNYYFLETDTTNNIAEAVNQYDALGLTHDGNKETLLEYLVTSNTLDGKLFVFNNEIYGPDIMLGEKLKEELGIPSDGKIKTFKLSELLEQQQIDLDSVKNDFSNQRSYPALPDYRKTKAVTLAAIEADYQNVMDVPVSVINENIALKMAERDGKSLEMIPREYITEDLCLNAVSSEGMALKFVPDKFHSDKLYQKAVENDCWALQLVPEEKRTKDLCRSAITEALEYSHQGYNIIEHIPHSDICYQVFKHASDSNRVDIIELLEKISPDIVDKKIALKAIEGDANAINFIPKDLKTPDFYNEAVKANGYLLAYIPDKVKTPEMCLNVIGSCSDLGYEPLAMIAYVPYPDICIKYLKEAKGSVDVFEVFASIPENVLTPKLVNPAIDLDIECFKYIPDSMKTKEMCLKVIDEIGPSEDPFRYIPTKLRTDEHYQRAVEVNENAILWIPEDKVTHQMCLSVISKNEKDIWKIPEIMRTPEVYLTVVKKNKSLEVFVPRTISNAEEMNIYRFGILAEKNMNQTLTVNQIKDLYEGKTLTIKDKDANSGKEKIVNVSYNKVKNTLDYRYPVLDKIRNVFRSKDQGIHPPSKKRI